MHFNIPGVSACDGRVMPLWSTPVAVLPSPRLCNLGLNGKRLKEQGAESSCFFQSSLVRLVLFFPRLLFFLRENSSKVLVLKTPNNKTVVIIEL